MASGRHEKTVRGRANSKETAVPSHKIPVWLRQILIVALQSAGVISVLVCGIDIIGLILMRQAIQETMFGILGYVASFGWFGAWSILYTRKLDQQEGKK